MIFRIHKDSHYVAINNNVLQDTKLSFTARGILAYLLSLPDDWHVESKHLLSQGSEGRRRIAAGLKELETAGYFERKRHKDKKGRWRASETNVYENPRNKAKSPIKIHDTAYGDADNGDAESGIIYKVPTDKVPKEQKKPLAPQILLFREVTNHFPNKALYPEVIRMMGKDPMPARVLTAYKAWIARGYNPRAITWLEWYQNGIPSHAKMTQAEMNRGGNGLVL